MGLEPDSVFPLRTWHEKVYSGELWYGFYGKKGIPIFEGLSSVLMRHPGRYRDNSKIDACIVSFRQDTS